MITLEIHGMMCSHCEARVKSTLEALSGVESAEVSAKDKVAHVKLTAPDVSREALVEAVVSAGYKCKLK